MAIPKIASYALPTLAEFPSSKVHWDIQPERAALLIHDMQDYFVGFYDENSPLMQTVIQNIAHLKAWARQLNIPVFYTAQPAEQPDVDRALLNDMWGPGVTRYPEQQSIVQALLPESGDQVLTKWRYSAFHRSNLQEQLQAMGRDQLVITGVYAHIGVMLTAADAFMRDIQAFLIGDAIADFSRAEHLMALQYVAGRCGRVMDSRHVLALGQPAKDGLTFEAVRAQIIALLDEADDDFTDQDNLLDYGLDSVQIMQLVNQWNKAGIELGFVELAQNPSVSGWWQLIAAQQEVRV